MKFFAFLKSRTFLFNFILSILFVAGVFFGVYRWLNTYTNHGQSIVVPDLKGLSKDEIATRLSGENLRFAVVDSSLFDLTRPPGTVIEQEPAPGSHVKENRTIYLTITKTVPPQIRMPNLIDVSYRQAEAILKSYGLKVGEIIYKPDLAKNAVLEMLVNGTPVNAGDEVTKGTTIDLVLGDGFGNRMIKVPNLVGLSLDEAIFVIKGSALNLGELNFERAVKDSMSTVVYQQYPASSGSINQGEAIDLYLR